MSWRELLPPWLVIAAGLTGIVLLCVSTKDVPVTPPRTKYGIVLDAGPSHIILVIYQWTTTKASSTGVIREWSSCPVQGISSYSDSVGKSLEPCLNWAQKEIPAEQHSQTPLYLGATTSRKQLNLTHPILSESLLAALTVALKSSPFSFQGAKILSGPEKEAFTWVAVNYVLENFFKYDWRGQLVPSGKGMAGILSLGATSAELTSKVEDEKQAPKEGVRLQLYGQTHKVHTHHCPCHGTEPLRSRLLSLLLREQRSATAVGNPCWPLSYSRAVQWPSVHTGPCAATEDTLDTPGPEEIFNITGSSDPTACLTLVQRLLNSSSSSCSFFKHRLSKPLQSRLLVISEAMDFMRETIPNPDLGQAVNRLCGMSIKELVKESQTRLDALVDYCLVSAFIFHLSTKGFTFDLDGSIWTAFQKKMANTSSGWTLGYLLSLTNTIPQDTPRSLKGIEPGIWSLLLILFVVLLTGSFMRISYRVMVKENSFSNRNSSVFDDN